MGVTRETEINAVLSRGMAARKRVYGYDSDGTTYEVTTSARDTKRYQKGAAKVPPTCKAMCVEGDKQWVSLSGWVTVEQFKAQVSRDLKWTRRRNQRQKLDASRHAQSVMRRWTK